MNFNYYYGSEADQFSFIRIPKVMLTEETFAPLSLNSKILYGVLLDRMSLSMKNGWLDKENRVYIIFQINEIQEILGFSKKKSMDYLAELEKFGLVEKKRRGLGLPSILYIKSFLVEQGKENTDYIENEIEDNGNGTSRSVDLGTSANVEDNDKIDEIKGEDANIGSETIEKPENIVNIQVKSKLNRENPEIKCATESRSVEMSTSRSIDLGTSRGSEKALQEVPESTPLINNTKDINTKNNKSISNPFISNQERTRIDEMGKYERIIKSNIEYDMLVDKYPLDQELINGIVDLMLETVISKSETTVIARNEYPTQLVKSKFLKLNITHIEYVMDCLKDNCTKVRNMKKYLLTSLFNAPSTISGYYQSKVNYDMYT